MGWGQTDILWTIILVIVVIAYLYWAFIVFTDRQRMLPSNVIQDTSMTPPLNSSDNEDMEADDDLYDEIYDEIYDDEE